MPSCTDSVVLIHGFGLHSFVWRPLMDCLNGDYKVQADELPGYGATPATSAAPLEAVRGYPQEAHWVAWSMGALLALAAIEVGARPRSLTLLAAQPCMVARQDWPCAIDSNLFEGFRQELAGDPPAAMQQFIRLMVLGDKQAPALRKQLQGQIQVMAAATYDWGMKTLASLDHRKTWAETEVPLMCLWGATDELLPVAAMEPLKQLRPRASFNILPAVGHTPMLSAPDRCAEILQSFWSTA